MAPAGMRFAGTSTAAVPVAAATPAGVGASNSARTETETPRSRSHSITPVAAASPNARLARVFTSTNTSIIPSRQTRSTSPRHLPGARKFR